MKELEGIRDQLFGEIASQGRIVLAGLKTTTIDAALQEAYALGVEHSKVDGLTAEAWKVDAERNSLQAEKLLATIESMAGRAEAVDREWRERVKGWVVELRKEFDHYTADWLEDMAQIKGR